MEDNIVLTMRGICMTFPGVKALDNVDFTLRKGEIHALMGENGAGKSTLIKCLTGINDFEAGEIRVNGIEGPVKNHSTLDAQKVGISTVFPSSKSHISRLNRSTSMASRHSKLYVPSSSLGVRSRSTK